jgi:hypothetical protein
MWKFGPIIIIIIIIIIHEVSWSHTTHHSR